MSVRNRYSKQLLSGRTSDKEELEHKPDEDIFPKELDQSSGGEESKYSPMISTEKLESSKIRDDLICGICRDIFLNPVTLICQHTYCRTCIKSIDNKKCPMCDLAYFLPNNDNKTFESVIGILFPEEYKQRQQQFINDETKKDLREKMREEIRKEIQNQVVSELVDADEVRNVGHVYQLNWRQTVTPESHIQEQVRVAINTLKKPSSILMFSRLILIIFQFQLGLYILNEIYPIPFAPIRNMILYLQMMTFIVASMVVFFSGVVIKSITSHPVYEALFDSIFSSNQ